MHDRAIWNNFERLYIDYQPRLIAYALRFVGDSVEAQDLVQDCFVRLWDDYAELEEDEAPMLLFTMMRHRCLNFLKQNVSSGSMPTVRSPEYVPTGGGKNVSIISVFPITRPNTLIFIRSWSARSSVSRIRFLSAAARFSSSAVFRG